MFRQGKKHIIYAGDWEYVVTRDASPKDRRVGYLLYQPIQSLDSMYSDMDLKADVALCIVTSRGIPLAQLIFHDYNDIPVVKYNTNHQAKIDREMVKQLFMQNLGISEPCWS